jgi:hypothetical protein
MADATIEWSLSSSAGSADKTGRAPTQYEEVRFSTMKNVGRGPGLHVHMNSAFRLAVSTAVCAAVVGCASTEDAAPSPVVRTAAPKGYEQTINNFFAFRIRGPQDNAVIAVSAPEPGACPLDGYSASIRGWVVPTIYETRTREASGKGAVHVTTKLYYFWFLGNTIAGISPRMESCPGMGMTFGEDVSPKQVAERLDAEKVTGGQNQETANGVKKAGTSPAVVRRPVKKAGSSGAKAKPAAAK